GAGVGTCVGAGVGTPVGSGIGVGSAVGSGVGAAVGAVVGAGVGEAPIAQAADWSVEHVVKSSIWVTEPQPAGEVSVQHAASPSCEHMLHALSAPVRSHVLSSVSS